MSFKMFLAEVAWWIYLGKLVYDKMKLNEDITD